jgi:hypothetical protein
MLKHSSASPREQTPHVNHPTRTATIMNALVRRAQAILNDKSIDAQSRAVIRYALETHDPWLARLVRRADAGALVIADSFDFAETPPSGENDSSDEKIEAMTEKLESLTAMLCRAGDEPATKSAALLVLMATLEKSSYPKALANTVKHLAF